MKNINILLVVLLVLNINAFCQKINFETDYNLALQKAQQQGKYLLVQIETNNGCTTCNRLGKEQYEDANIIKKINNSFVPLYITTKSKDYNILVSLYDINNETFGTLFIENNGDLLYKYLQTSSRKSDFANAIDKAINRNNENLNLSTIQKIYTTEKTKQSLALLIEARVARDLSVDSLLDIYTSLIDTNSIDLKNEILFIQKNAPISGSIAYKFAFYQNISIPIWMTIPLMDRIKINNKILSNTFKKAYKNNDEQLLLELKYFIYRMYSDTKDLKFPDKRIRECQMLFYEKNNINKYYSSAELYLKIHFLPISVDSIRILDSLRKIEAFKSSKIITNRDTIIDGIKMKAGSKSFNFIALAQYYAKIYNHIAWKYYSTTKDSILLRKALIWAERGYLHYKTPDVIDTYARLLYVLGNKQKAIIIMKECIELYSQNNYNINDNDSKKVYELMLQNKSSIDEYQ